MASRIVDVSDHFDSLEETSRIIESLLAGSLSKEIIQPSVIFDPKSLWSQIKNEIIASYSNYADAGRIKQEGKAIITAGSPGAGKSFALKRMQEIPEINIDFNSFVTIDADDIKQLLLGNDVTWLPIQSLGEARAHWDDLLKKQKILPDGRPLMRGELAFLVHELSTYIHHIIYEVLAEKRCNLIVEGTLRWMPTSTTGVGIDLIKLFENKHYDSITIVAVNASESTCIQGARERWKEKRIGMYHESRYTPFKAVENTFIEISQDRKISIPVVNAQATHHFAHLRGTFDSLTLFVIHRDAERPSLQIERSKYIDEAK